jgi:hypothetical protein
MVGISRLHGGLLYVRVSTVRLSTNESSGCCSGHADIGSTVAVSVGSVN